MANFYDDAKFGVIQRTWFGLTQKNGGQDTVITFTASATMLTHVSKWHPRGPIKIQKVGYLVQATLCGKATNKGRRQMRFYTRGASASLVAAIVPASCGTVAAYTFNSSSSLTVAQCKAGEYIRIRSGSPRTYKAAGYTSGTETLGSTTGSVAFFIDWVPTYDYSGKWDKT